MIKKRLAVLLLAVLILSLPLIACTAADSPVAVVKTGETEKEFTSADEALSYALKNEKSNALVTLTSDWNVGAGAFTDGARFVVPEGKKLSLDLGGFTINAGENGRVFRVKKGASLTITDSGSGRAGYSSSIRGGVITGGRSDYSGGAIELDEKATLRMKGGSIVSCFCRGDGGAVYLDEDAVAEIDGTGFYSNRVYDSNSELYGGAVCSDGGKLTLRNCIFEGNYSEDDGGAVYLDSDRPTEITGCSFTCNKAREIGGALYVNGSGGTTLRDNVFSYNTASELGGAICVNADRVYLLDNVITFNTASEKGGGVYVDSFYDISACGKLIIENNTDKDGKSDLCLQSGMTSTARLNCGGFTEGAHVGIDIADDSDSVFCNEISFYQINNFLFADRGTLSFTKEKKISENFVSSAIGRGSVRNIIIGAVVLVAFSVGVPLVVRKRKAGEADES